MTEHAVRRHAAPEPWVQWVIAGLGCAAAVVSFLLIFDTAGERAPAVHAALVGWIIVAYVLCGLIAWRQRPDSRFGLLMVAAGFAPFLSSLAFSGAGIPLALGEVCRRLPLAVFLHLFLSYPTGRLQTQFERLVVVFSYVVALSVGVVAAALGGGGPNTVLEVVDRPSAADVVYQAQAGGLLILMLCAIGVLVVRWRRSGHTPRRSGLVLGSFLLALLALTVGGFVAAETGSAAPVRWVVFGLIAITPVAFLIRLLGARLARSSVGDLFVDLRTDPAPGELRDALARALRDPSLTLAYWLPEFGSYADLEGRVVELPEEGSERAVTFIDQEGVRIAAIVHDPALQDERELLAAVKAAAGMALENAQLHAELRARLEELQGSRARIVEAGRMERQRLERNLHDGAQQRLVALSLELSLLEEQLDADAGATEKLVSARREIAASLDELREVARGLHPAVVSAHGLAIALEQLVAHASVPVRLTLDISARLPEALEVAAYYLVSESLANVGKYAHASAASVEVTRRRLDVLIEVVDDGVGGADESNGSGLRGLADRVEALGGKLRVWSPVGGGTRVRAEIPCAP